jgi:hypothetical protein
VATDLDPARAGIGGLSKNPVRAEIYFDQGATLTVLDLATLEMRPLCSRPQGCVGGRANATTS